MVSFISSKLRLTLICVAVKSTNNEEQAFKIFFHVLTPVMICSVAGFFFVYYLRHRRARKKLKYHRENCNVELKIISICDVLML